MQGRDFQMSYKNAAALLAVCILLTGCSGGNSSSTGSGGAAPAGGAASGQTTAVRDGEYSGNITFSELGDSTPVTVNVDKNGRVIIDSSGAGAAIGNASGSSLTASGNLEYVLAGQRCTAASVFEGSAFGNTISGTVSAPSASCVENGMRFTLSLDGEFTATR